MVILESIQWYDMGSRSTFSLKDTFSTASARRWLTGLFAGLLMAAAEPHNNAQADRTAVLTDVAVNNLSASLVKAGAPDKLLTVADVMFAVAETPRGRALLTFAVDRGVTVGYDTEGYLTSRGAAGAYLYETKSILLQQEMSDDKKVQTLLHELKHACMHLQLDIISFEKRFLSPRERWALKQHEEADAAAYEAFCMAERAFLLKTPLDTTSTEPLDRIALRLYEEMSSADGVTLAEYRDMALRPSFATLSFYHSALMKEIQQETEILGERVHFVDSLQQAGADIRLPVAILRGQVNDAPKKHETERLLRRFGGTDLEPTAPTALSGKDVPYKDILDTYPQTPSGSPFRAAFMRSSIERFLIDQEKIYDSLCRRIIALEATAENKKIAGIRKPSGH